MLDHSKVNKTSNMNLISPLLQLVVGFVSFWVVLCCERATAGYRARMVPVHATFGVITFFLAIATALTGYTERAIFSLK